VAVPRNPSAGVKVTVASAFTSYVPSPGTVRVWPPLVASGLENTTLAGSSSAVVAPALSLPSTPVVTGVWYGVWLTSSAATGVTGVTVTTSSAVAVLPKESVTA